jgi:regulator of sigma E protease
MIELISPLWNTIFPFLLVLTVLVFIHEMGHYAVARWAGVRVEVFSVGFGPELIGWTDKADTRWKISAVPLGGYVKMFGEGDFEDESDVPRLLTEAEKKVSFRYKPLFKRALIVFAGPAANFIFAIIVLATLFSTLGQPFSPAEVGTVVPDSAASAAGFRPGDTFLKIENDEIERFEDVQQIIRLNPEKPLSIVMLRDGVEITLVATPKLREIKDRTGGTHRIGMLGVTRQGVKFEKRDPLSAVWYAGRETWSLVTGTLQAVGQMISGERDAGELGGPIKIAQMSGEVWKAGILSLVSFMALLSVNLGLINLFPVPMLDGGHLMFFCFEAIRGRPLSEKIQEYALKFGLAMVLSLMVFVTINDIINLPYWNS